MGRESQVVTRSFTNGSGETVTKELELFTWEKLDRLEDVKTAFGL